MTTSVPACDPLKLQDLERINGDNKLQQINCDIEGQIPKPGKIQDQQI